MVDLWSFHSFLQRFTLWRPRPPWHRSQRVQSSPCAGSTSRGWHAWPALCVMRPAFFWGPWLRNLSQEENHGRIPHHPMEVLMGKLICKLGLSNIQFYGLTGHGLSEARCPKWTKTIQNHSGPTEGSHNYWGAQPVQPFELYCYTIFESALLVESAPSSWEQFTWDALAATRQHCEADLAPTEASATLTQRLGVFWKPKFDGQFRRGIQCVHIIRISKLNGWSRYHYF